MADMRRKQTQGKGGGWGLGSALGSLLGQVRPIRPGETCALLYHVIILQPRKPPYTSGTPIRPCGHAFLRHVICPRQRTPVSLSWKWVVFEINLSISRKAKFSGTEFASYSVPKILVFWFVFSAWAGRYKQSQKDQRNHWVLPKGWHTHICSE